MALPPQMPVEAHEVEAAREAMKAAQPSDRATRLRYNYEELQGQPEAIRVTLTAERERIDAIARLVAERGRERFYGIGCGDSWAIAQAVKAPFEVLLGQPFDACQALEFYRYACRFVSSEDVVIGLSASGTTSETISGLQAAREAGGLTIGVTNKADSPFTRVPEIYILGHAMRRASFPTQASTVGLAALLALAGATARARGGQDQATAELDRWLNEVPTLVAEIIQAAESVAREIGGWLVRDRVFVFVGAGPGLAAAMFGANKIREGCQEHAYVIGTEEFHHYEIASRGTPVFLVAPTDVAHSRALDVARVTKERGGLLISVVAEGETGVATLSDYVFRVPATPDHLVGLPYTTPLQLAAWHIARAKLDAGQLSEREL